MKKRIGLIFGGRSGEHEVSVRSAATVAAQIDSDKFEVLPMAIAKDGKWLGLVDSGSLLPEESRGAFAEVPNGSVGTVSLLANGGGFALIDGEGGSSTPLDVDVAFPVLHGTFGEDGTLQGMLEMADIPYVGCGVLASSCGMDKVVMKALFKDAGLPICKFLWFLRGDWQNNRDKVVEEIEDKLGFPCFVKPANLGSSVGVSQANDREELNTAVELAAQYDRKIVVEEGLKAREIECAVLGNETAEASFPGEYIIREKSKTFLDYTEKYAGTGNNEFVVPAPISEELSSRIRKMAIRAFKSVDGSGLARVDFFLRSDNGALLLNEINTLPGLTSASGYPKMWAATGKPFKNVIEDLIRFAEERYEERSSIRTSLEA